MTSAMFPLRTSQISVMGDNNTLLYGCVVDVADNGLYIDLLCTDRRREFIPFNRLFSSNITECADIDRKTQSWETLLVEVLRREYPGGAWRWWPGKITNPPAPQIVWWSHCTVAVVQGQEDSGVTWTDIFPQHRIRFHVPDYWWAEQLKERRQVPNVTLPVFVPPGRFVKRSMPLPDDCRGASEDQLLRVRNGTNLNQFATFDWLGYSAGEVVCVDIVDGQLHCIMDLYDSVSLPQPENPAQEIVQPLLRALTLWIPYILRKTTASVETGMIGEPPVLGVDVWQQVFAHLDTITRTLLRRVSLSWEAVLGTPALAADIIIEISEASKHLRCLYCTGYTLTAPIFKCLHPSVKHVILNNRGPATCYGMDGFFALLSMIHYTTRVRPGIHLKAVYVVGVRNLMANVNYEFSLADPFNTGPEVCPVHNPEAFSGTGTSRCTAKNLQHFVALCRGLPCNAINLVRCGMCLEYNMLDICERLIRLDIDMAMTRLPLSGDFASALWHTLETALAASSDNEVRALTDWLSAIATENNQWV